MTSFTVEPLDATFGAVVSGRRVVGLGDDEFAELYALWLEYALLIFPDQHLTNAEQTEFALRFGPLEFDTTPITNVRSDGTLRAESRDDHVLKTLRGNQGWHHDSTYMPVRAKGAVFTAHVVPTEGGETGWADARAAYDDLDDDVRERIETLSAYHSINHSQRAAGIEPDSKGEYKGYGYDQETQLRPLVTTHSETGRRALQIGRHAFAIPGLPDVEATALLSELNEFTTDAQRTYHHDWTPGDAVVWDNRSLLHRGCPWDMTQPRVMYHTRLAGDPATEAGRGVAVP